MVKQNRPSELPNLAPRTEIVARNLRAVQTIYIAAMLEELRMFQVVDRLAQLFQQGILTVNRESVGRTLYKYWRETPLRLSETERRNLFSRTLGIVAGADGTTVNRGFNDLWLRFISSVATLNRERVTNVDTANSRAVVELAVRRAASDLARNLSLQGSGMAFYAALDLQKQIEMSIRLLSEPEVKSAYGARDAWQVIDQVATIDLGGARNSSRFRSMANSGSTIISWLATNIPRLKPNSQRAVLKVHKSPSRHLKEFHFSAKPTDSDLVNACEQWLAVNGVIDGQIEQPTQPGMGAAK